MIKNMTEGIKDYFSYNVKQKKNVSCIAYKPYDIISQVCTLECHKMFKSFG